MDDSQNIDFQDGELSTPEATSGITPEEQARIDRIKRRNLVIAAIFGIILLVLGFFAGRSAQEKRDDSSPVSPSFSVCDVLENWGQLYKETELTDRGAYFFG